MPFDLTLFSEEKHKSDLLPVVVLCALWDWRATEARWCCHWQHRRGKRLVGSRWGIWRGGPSLSLCRIRTRSCRASDSGPGSPRPAPTLPATSTARPTSAASGHDREELCHSKAFLSFANQHARTSKDLYDKLIIPMTLKILRLPYLDVRAGSEPRLVGQHLVNVV